MWIWWPGLTCSSAYIWCISCTGSNILKWYDLSITLWPPYLASSSRRSRGVVSKSMFILVSPGTRAGQGWPLHFSVHINNFSSRHRNKPTSAALRVENFCWELRKLDEATLKTIDPLVNIMPCNVPIVARNVCDMTFVLLNIIPPWYSPRPVIMCSELGAIICHRGASHVDIRRHQSHHHRHNRYCGLSGDSMRTNQIKKTFTFDE